MSAAAQAMVQVISGAIVMGYGVVGLFFLRFWRETRDRLFFIFSIAFFILGIQRVLLGFARDMEMMESTTGLYLLRLFAFLLILLAIVDKNRGGQKGPRS